MATAWTTKIVREQLPDVPVKLGCLRTTGRLSGRNNDFATLTVDVPCSVCQSKTCKQSFPLTREVSWATLAACLSENGFINLT